MARDKFEQHYQTAREKKKQRQALIQTDEDAPLPDAPVEQAKAEKTPGRNDPCPCGSGRKYKKCCGKGK